MSNLFKTGFQGIKNVSDEPYIIDVSKRVIEPPKNRIIRSVQEKQTEEDENNSGSEDEFKEGISDMAEEVSTPVNQELLDDAMDKAKDVLDEARELAKKIVDDANAEAESIKQQAKEEGYNQGLEEGSMEAMKRADEYLENINKEKEIEIMNLKQEMFDDIQETERQITDIACGLIEKLTGILVEDYKPVMIHMINNVLNEDDASRKFVIRVSEEQYTYISDNQERLSGAANPGITIEIFGDKKLSPGQCQIESDTGIVDLSMDVQVRNLITAIKLLSE